MGLVNNFIWLEGWVGTYIRVVGSHPDIHDHILENQRQMDRIGESSDFWKTMVYDPRSIQFGDHSLDLWDFKSFFLSVCPSSEWRRKFFIKKINPEYIDLLFKVFCDCDSISVLKERDTLSLSLKMSLVNSSQRENKLDKKLCFFNVRLHDYFIDG